MLSLTTAAPKTSAAPIQPVTLIVSRKKIAEQSTDTTGSRYPKIAIVCTGKLPIPLK